jgi:cell division septum initiation protein DivIVA
MNAEQQADELAAKAAKAVRRVVADAEDSAAQIVREAEAEAERIRERAQVDATEIRDRAEADARDQIGAAKRVLDDLDGTLVEAASETIPKAETPGPEPEPQPGPEAPGTPDAAARMVAMKMAVDGKDRAAIEVELNERFGTTDRSALLNEVLSRAAQLSRH